jgi:ABC-2 type transport system permease protein
MNRMWDVFRFELGRGLRRKGYLITTFGIPLIGIVLVLVIRFAGTLPAFNSTQMITQAMEQVNEGIGIQAAGLVDETGRFGPHILPSDNLTLYLSRDAAAEAMEAGDIQGFYVIPADYMDTGMVTLVLPGMDINRISAGPIQNLVIRVLASDMDAQVVNRLLQPSIIQETNVSLVAGADSAGEDGFGGALVIIYVLALALLISLFMTNGYLMQSVIEEKETRLIEILLASVRSNQLLTGKILANGAMGLFQMLVWLGGMLLALRLAGGDQLGDTVNMLASVANIQVPLNMLPLVLIYFVLAYLLFAGFYGMIGAVSNSMREGPQYATLLTLPAVVPLMFITVFAQDPNGGLAVGLSLFPLTSPLAMPMRLVISDVPSWQVIVSMALLALSGAGMIWAAGRVFRMQVLLAGKMPRLRDLPRLVRSG